MRQEFERHRYVSQLRTVDVLLFNSHSEFQVRLVTSSGAISEGEWNWLIWRSQETLNFWKQLTHVLKYFRVEEDPKAQLPKNFMQGFIEVCSSLVPEHA